MDTARQIIRYSIPGSVAVLVALAVHSMYLSWVHQVSAAHLPLSTVTSGQAATIAVVTIPLGFLLYQFYFAKSGPVVGGRHVDKAWLPVRADRGSDALCAIRTEDVDRLHRVGIFTETRDVVRPGWMGLGLRLDPQKLADIRSSYVADHDSCSDSTTQACPYGHLWCRCADLAGLAIRQEWIAFYRLRCSVNWQATTSLLSAADVTQAPLIQRSEYTTISDIYHGLGCTRLAVSLSLAATLGYELVSYHGAQLAWEYLAACGVAGLLLWSVLTRVRAHTWSTLAVLLRNSFAVFGGRLIAEISSQSSPRAAAPSVRRRTVTSASR